ncbi:hypothetical protein TrVE_jg5644 [Triparma verrucosa]|uniref:Thioredoxin domain-containing protein n=1 Tax=Triparma verrucosa TaxID=1606542 RepID=A0A9W7FE58_9STRA|nr:hypothetical protein TrVE_jg5644 [Triparma verrucosa]
MHLIRRFLASLLLLCSAARGLEVVRLNDSNFEHDTQATTGATTGNWLVAFCPTFDCSTFPNLSSLLVELSVDDDLLESGVVVATMHPEDSLKTYLRFKIETTSKRPVLLYLNKGLYTFSGNFAEEDELKDWVLTGYRKWNSKPVPKPFKGGIYFGYKDMTDFLNDFNRINNKHGMLINCVCLGSGLFLMIMLAMFIIKISEDSTPSESKKDD